MSWRIVIISSQSKLDYKMGYMVVRNVEGTQRVFLDEMAIIILENPRVSMTGCLIEAFIDKKVKVIFCDSQRNPAAELSPHHGSHDSTSKIRIQAAWNNDIKNRVWQEIVSEKIHQQHVFLKELNKETEASQLQSYMRQVEPGDISNREGHAAKVYFNALFGMDFTRGSLNPINAALNYGYSLILSAFNREVTANGYLTQLGIFHSNMFNHYNLSCDLMEPFRIIVDRFVFQMQPVVFEKEEKHEMWNILGQDVLIDGNHQNSLNAIRIYTKSVFDAINDKDVSKIRSYSVI